jgi:hypothetical protein
VRFIRNALLIPLLVLKDVLEQLSVTKTEDRDYWHIVIQEKLGWYFLRLLGGKDGPDLTECNIGSAAKATVST